MSANKCGLESLSSAMIDAFRRSMKFGCDFKGILQFGFPTQDNVAYEEEADGEDGESEDVLPQVPRRAALNPLPFQVH